VIDAYGALAGQALLLVLQHRYIWNGRPRKYGQLFNYLFAFNPEANFVPVSSVFLARGWL
jgi:hypothetical protein